HLARMLLHNSGVDARSGSARAPGAPPAPDVTEDAGAKSRYGQILTGVASRLLASGDRHQTLARLVEVVVPAMCDWAIFSVRDDRTGLLRTVELRHRDPERAILASTAEKRFQPRADADRGPGLACRTGRSQLD